MQTRLPLNNLNTFAFAAEYLSFQKAAEALFVTPSAVSHQVRNLEQVLGYKLFERLDKKVRLTYKGERLFNDIRIPIKEIHEASRKASRSIEDNSLALSVAPIIATGWLLPRLKNFYQSYPDINLSVIASSDMANFNTDSFDASIRIGSGNWPDLNAYALFKSEIIAVCHPSLIDQHGGLFSSNELSHYLMVHNSSMPNIWGQWLESAGIKELTKNQGELEVQNSAQLIEVLQSGDSIGLVDRNLVKNDIKSGRLALAHEHVHKSDDGYFLTAPKSSESLVSFQSFKQWLETQLSIK